MNYASILTNFPGIAAARVPQDVHFFFEDFRTPLIGNTKVTTWKRTACSGQGATGCAILAGTDDHQELAGGILSMTCEATIADGDNLTVHGEGFQIKDGYPLYFESRIQTVVKAVSNMWVGLTGSDADCIEGGVTEAVGFETKAGSIYIITAHTTEKETDTTLDLTAAVFCRLAFFFDGVDTINFYVDVNDDGGFAFAGSRKVSTTLNYVPENVMLTPTVEHSAVGTTSPVAYVDYILCVQQRHRNL